MIYTADQILLDLRDDLADRGDVDDEGLVRDTLWSDTELLRYLSSAIARWAGDTLGLRRRFEYPVLAGNPLVRVPFNEVIEIIQVNLTTPGFGRARRLEEFNLTEGLWHDDYGIRHLVSPDLATTGSASHFTRDYDDQFMRIYPVPMHDAVIEVHAYVVPGIDIAPGMPLPQALGRRDIDLVMGWAKNLAYRKQDADVLDLTRADAYRAEYLFEIRDRASEIQRARREAGYVAARY